MPATVSIISVAAKFQESERHQVPAPLNRMSLISKPSTAAIGTQLTSTFQSYPPPSELA
jgi:hypothetical protein